MFVSVLSGVNKLYLFSHILNVWALIPERFSRFFILKVLLSYPYVQYYYKSLNKYNKKYGVHTRRLELPRDESH